MSGKTYEMLWDCSSCGTQGLLGKTHRRCPHCGAPQDPDTRYFPAPGHEVEAKDHRFVGVDWTCAACETPNSRAAGFCVNCGNPREGNADVARRPDRIVKDGQVVDDGKRAAGPAPGLFAGRRRRLFLALGAVFVGLVAFLLLAIFWQKDVHVLVEGHAWTREIDVERMAPRRDSSWCDSMPGDAYGVSRSREVRSHNQIPDGQVCSDRQTDNGDGTFSVSTECRTKYRSEPVYDDKCYYTVDRWGLDRTERATGQGLSPAWPAVSVSGGSCNGCTRQGSRREELTVRLRGRDQKTWTCGLDDGRWRRIVDGLETVMRVRVITGGAVCSSLHP